MAWNKKKEQEEINKAWNTLEPAEIDQLRADMSKKVQIRMNGRFQSRFVQVMLDRNVLKLDKWGDHVMCNPFEYTKMQKAEAKIAKSDRDEEDRMFLAFPEEREKVMVKRRKFFQDIRETIFGLSKEMKV